MSIKTVFGLFWYLLLFVLFIPVMMVSGIIYHVCRYSYERINEAIINKRREMMSKFVSFLCVGVAIFVGVAILKTGGSYHWREKAMFDQYKEMNKQYTEMNKQYTEMTEQYTEMNEQYIEMKLMYQNIKRLHEKEISVNKKMNSSMNSSMIKEMKNNGYYTERHKYWSEKLK